MAKKKKRKNRKNSSGVYTIVMFIIAIVLFFIIRVNPSLFENIKLPDINKNENTFTEGEASVHFIDVGQGDSVLIRLPLDNKEGYKNILIDSGEYGNGKKIINYLENSGVYTLDAVFVTHPHSDHMGCMAEIIRHFEVKSFYMPHFPENLTPITSSYESMLDALSEKGLKIKEVGSTDILTEVTSGVSGAKLCVLAPYKINKAEDLNNVSLIMKLYFGNNTFLFTGDAEIEELNTIRGFIGSADVLKVGHHGASNATDELLLAEVRPKYSVISVGKGNDYGHPHEKVLNMLYSIGSAVIRTDQTGSVVIKSNGNEINVN